MLAGINKIETAFGTNLNVSSAGAEGWMQFIPSTWAAYGVDANNDGRKDPYNPVDAICAAARYLRAAGGDQDIRQAIFAYNHADWYVDEVLLYANQYGKLPDALVGSLTGLTEGAHFPVAADARYADDINDAAALARSQTAAQTAGNAADVIRSNASRRSINIYSSLNAPVVAVNDGVIKKMGDNAEARQVHRPPGRLRQPVHLRAARLDREDASGAAPAAPLRARTSSSRRPTRTPPRALPRPPATTPRKRRPDGAPSRAQRRKRPGRTPRSSASASSPLPQRSGNAGNSGVAGQLDQLLGRSVPGLRDLQVGAVEQPPVRLQDDGAEAAQGRLQGHRRHGDRPGRPARQPSRRTSTSRSGPPARARRRSTRSRSSTAGSCSRPPRSTAPPTRTRSRPTRPSARSC